MRFRWLQRDGRPTGLESFQFDFSSAAAELSRAVASGGHVLLHGPPRQGKSTLARRVLGKRSVIVHLSESTSFADIARNMLIALGCSVVAERKSRWRGATKAEIKIKSPILEAGGGGEVGQESEELYRTFTTDIENPNDVCHLISQLPDPPVIVMEHFERLDRGDRRDIVEFLKVAGENAALQVILVASSGAGSPLSHRERIELNRILTIVHLPPMSVETTRDFMAAAMKHLGAQPPEGLAELVHSQFDGGLESTIEVCSLVHRRPPAPPRKDGIEPLAAYLDERFREHAKSYLLSLVSAIVEADWDIDCSTRRVLDQPDRSNGETGDGAADENPDDDVDVVEISPAWASDPVFERLRNTLRSSNYASASTRAKPLHRAAIALSRQLLACNDRSEAIRQLAAATQNYVSAPQGMMPIEYIPAHENDHVTLNTGLLLCALLRDADPEQPLLLTAEALEAFLKEYGLVLRKHRDKAFRKLCRRLRKLQARLYVDPPIFSTNGSRKQLRLWEPGWRAIYGDIRSDVELLLDDSEDEFVFEEEDRLSSAAARTAEASALEAFPGTQPPAPLSR